MGGRKQRRYASESTDQHPLRPRKRSRRVVSGPSHDSSPGCDTGQRDSPSDDDAGYAGSVESESQSSSGHSGSPLIHMLNKARRAVRTPSHILEWTMPDIDESELHMERMYADALAKIVRDRSTPWRSMKVTARGLEGDLKLEEGSLMQLAERFMCASWSRRGRGETKKKKKKKKKQKQNVGFDGKDLVPMSSGDLEEARAAMHATLDEEIERCDAMDAVLSGRPWAIEDVDNYEDTTSESDSASDWGDSRTSYASDVHEETPECPSDTGRGGTLDAVLPRPPTLRRVACEPHDEMITQSPPSETQIRTGTDLPTIFPGPVQNHARNKMLMNAIRRLPGGEQVSHAALCAVKDEVVELCSALRECPVDLSLSDRIELVQTRMTNSADLETSSSQNASLYGSDAVWSVLRPDFVRRAEQRAHAATWSHFLETTSEDDQNGVFVEDSQRLLSVAKDIRGRLNRVGFTFCSMTSLYLAKIYGSMASMAADESQLHEASPLLGDTLRSALVSYALHEQARELMERMRHSDADIAFQLIASMRTVTAVLNASVEDVSRALAGRGQISKRNLHRACIAIHGEGGMFLPLLLSSKRAYNRAHAAAAALHTRFGSLNEAADASLKTITSLSVIGAAPIDMLWVYEALHVQDSKTEMDSPYTPGSTSLAHVLLRPGLSAKAKATYRHTAVIWEACRRHVRRTDALEACADVMHGCGGDLERALTATPFEVAQWTGLDIADEAVGEVLDAVKRGTDFVHVRPTG